MTNTLVRIVPGILGVVVCASLHAAVLRSDGFETGDLTGPTWNGATNVSVTNERAYSGAYSAKFAFAAVPDNGDDASDSWAELDFFLGGLYSEVWIQYELYVPANYVHRDAIGPDNNKFFRMWGNTYNDNEKIGASTFPNAGGSRLQGEWNLTGGGMGEAGQGFTNFIGPSDLGRWMKIKVYAKAATATQNGTLKIWKSDTLIIDDSDQVNTYTAAESHAYRYGYLLGWANSGFSQLTCMYIDDVIMATTEGDLTSSTGVRPTALSVARSEPSALCLYNLVGRKVWQGSASREREQYSAGWSLSRGEQVLPGAYVVCVNKGLTCPAQVITFVK